MKRLLSVVLTLTLCMGLSAPALAARTFTDVPATYWAHDAIQYVVDEGLFSGTSAAGAGEAEAMMALITGIFTCNYTGALTGSVNDSFLQRLKALSVE